jgi:histidinol-phosphate aminotransferase
VCDATGDDKITNPDNIKMSFDINKLIRENIKKLKPYSSARDEFKGEAHVFLDANENSLGSPLTKWYNRYPDPLQWDLKKKISEIKSITPENMLLGNGSDECIDLLIRAFCEPKIDNIIICPPTYGMYEVCAHINDVPVKEVRLTANFQLDMESLENAINAHTKIIFLCSPNNPTANSLIREDIEMLLNNFDGLVVVDEAYINFSRQRTLSIELLDYPNLVVMQTFSKAWGLAALRLGLLMASQEVVSVLNKIKPPYNINQCTQDLVMKALDNLEGVNGMIVEIVRQRDELAYTLNQIPYVKWIYPSDANFLLVKMDNPVGVYEYLRDKGIIVRNRNSVVLCEGCLRITVGTEKENRELIDAMGSFKNEVA